MAAKKSKKMNERPESEQREITEFERRYMYGEDVQPESNPRSRSDPHHQVQAEPQQQQPQPAKRKKKSRLKRYVLLILFLLALIVVEYSAYKLISQYEVFGNNDIKKYENILTDAEKEEWQTRQALPQEVFIQVNTKIDVTKGNKANLRLINPPYSRYRYHVKLALLNPEQTLYQTDIDPGTVYAFVELNRILAPGDYNGVVFYEFLDNRGRLAGTYQVDVTLSVNEEEEAE